MNGILLLLSLFTIPVLCSNVQRDSFYSKCTNNNALSFVFLSKEATFEFVQDFFSLTFPNYKFAFFFQNEWFQENPTFFHSRVWSLHSAGHTVGLALHQSWINTFGKQETKALIQNEIEAFDKFTGLALKYLTILGYDGSLPIAELSKDLNAEFVLVPTEDIHVKDGTMLANTVGILPYNLVSRDSSFIDEQNTNYLLESIRLVEQLNGRIVPLNECLAKESQSDPFDSNAFPKTRQTKRDDAVRGRNSNKAARQKNEIEPLQRKGRKSAQWKSINKSVQDKGSKSAREKNINKSVQHEREKSQDHSNKEIRHPRKQEPQKSFEELYPTDSENNIVYIESVSVKPYGIRKYKYIHAFDTSSASTPKVCISTIIILLIGLLLQ